MSEVPRRPEDPSPAIVFLHRNELLGDALINIAAYRALRRARPRHRIVCLYAEDTAFRTTLKRLRPELIDEIAVEQPINRTIGAARRVLEAIPKPIDMVIDMRANLRALWTFFASTGLTPRYFSNTPAFFLKRGGKVLPEFRPIRSYDRRHRLVEIMLDRQLAFDPWIAAVPEAAHQAARLLPAGPTYIGMAPGPSSSNKFWPVERHLDFAERARKRGLTLVYFLGPMEGEHAEWIRKSAPEAVIIDLPSAGGNREYLPWLIHAASDRVAATVAVEGGLGHLIASRGNPLLTLAGPTDPICWKPVTQRWWLLRAQDFGGLEMSAIPAAPVMALVEEMLRVGLPSRIAADG